MCPVICVSDIHGQLFVFPKIKELRRRYPSAHVVFGGDYQDSIHHHTGLAVADTIRKMKIAEPDKIHVIKGNHDQLLWQSLTGKNTDWFEAGGDDIIEELSLTFTQSPADLWEAIELVKRKYAFLITWIGLLPMSVRIGHLIVVHAGIDLTLADPVKETSEHDKLWMREPYWYSAFYPNYAHNPLDAAIISGHTPTSLITGIYDGQPSQETLRNRTVSPRGILTVQYKNEYARFFIDGGNHSGPVNHIGNIGVFDADTGRLIEAIEDSE
ncbi:metallophosphoesterase [Levilactobacillus hammesii]|uniref:Serine threonine protein phosphatase n=1 Tax=Levilactobacillus hammesii DSM 16381 TaxID=1423753 RepID=A0A0R1UWX3_9LACO|nr:metallophosphoesterase [Levilactobacillus hammesii]KRL97622.1 serine threonine protein phosphatase [Levilactobacillus hammesii DSM 16381]